MKSFPIPKNARSMINSALNTFSVVALHRHPMDLAVPAVPEACPAASTSVACLVEEEHVHSTSRPVLAAAVVSISVTQTISSASSLKPAAAVVVEVEWVASTMTSSMLGGMPGGRPPRGGGFSQKPRAPTPEPTIVEKDLPVTLEEIFKGTTKKVKTKSKAFDASGKRTVEELTLEATIKPGLRAGSKIKYKNVGDQEEGGRQDMHLIVKEVSDNAGISPRWIHC